MEIADISLNIVLGAIDTMAWVITFVGYLIVFLALSLLYFVFSNLPKVLNIKIKRKLREKGEPEPLDTELNISGEINAAVSMALFMHFNEMHDEESYIITIDKISRRYSPWSSKIYGVRNHHMFNALKKTQKRVR